MAINKPHPHHHQHITSFQSSSARFPQPSDVSQENGNNDGWQAWLIDLPITLVHMTYKSKVNSKRGPAETGSHSVDEGNLSQTSSLHRWLVRVWISLIPVTQHLFTEHGHLGLISIPKLFWKNRRHIGQYSVNSYCQLHAALHQNWTNEGAW